MIKTRTVFVLGAGASVPYGLPSGAELREILCQLGEDERSDYATQLRAGDLYTQDDLKVFSREFLRSGVYSIDRFLAQQSKHQPLGKLAIAVILCSGERPELLVRCQRTEDWYSALWNAMIYEVENAPGIGGNQVRFVTFNYDRSREYFLHLTITNTFGVADNGTLAGLRGSILHLYGQLGDFCVAPREGGRTYAPNLALPFLQTAAQGIRIIPEARVDEREFQVARNWFDWAERVCFLGFSFDPLNVRRLGLAHVIGTKVAKGQALPVYASVYGLTAAEVGTAARGVCDGREFNPGHRQWKNLETLREFGLLL